jgi:hypothetical protein
MAMAKRNRAQIWAGLSALRNSWFPFPGALPQAGMERTFGAEEKSQPPLPAAKVCCEV